MSWINRLRAKISAVFAGVREPAAEPGESPRSAALVKRRRRRTADAASVRHERRGKPKRPRRPKAGHQHAYQFRDAVLCNALRASRARAARMLKTKRKKAAERFTFSPADGTLQVDWSQDDEQRYAAAAQ